MIVNIPKNLSGSKADTRKTEQAHANSLDEKQGLASSRKIFGASIINAVKREVCDYSEEDDEHEHDKKE